MAGLIKGLVKKKQEEKKEAYNSANNFIFYGNGGKSSTAGALSLFTPSPVLYLSPSGSAADMESQYDNVISYQIDNLEELETILADINTDFQDAKKIANIVAMNDTERLAKAKEVYTAQGEDWEEVLHRAKNNIMPISAIVVEEVSLISYWLKERCTEELELNGQIGENKSLMGSDWDYLKRKTLDFYIDILKFPVITILATGDREPGEKQNLKQTTMDMCSGAAQRALQDLTGNVINFSYLDGKYTCRLVATPKIFAKNKIAKIYSKEKVPEELDLTNQPEVFWKLFFKFRKEDVGFRTVQETSIIPANTRAAYEDEDAEEKVVEPVIKTPAKEVAKKTPAPTSAKPIIKKTTAATKTTIKASTKQ